MNDNFDIAYLPLIIAIGLFNPRKLKLSWFLHKELKKENQYLPRGTEKIY